MSNFIKHKIFDGSFYCDDPDVENRQDCIWYATGEDDWVATFHYEGRDFLIHTAGVMRLELTYGDKQETIRTGRELFESGVWAYLGVEPTDYNFQRYIEHALLPNVSADWVNNNWFYARWCNDRQGWDEITQSYGTFEEVCSACRNNELEEA